MMLRGYRARGKHLARLLLFSTVLVSLTTLSAPPTPVLAARHRTRLADLPLAAQALVSATLGRDDPASQFQLTADGYRLADPSGRWRADFSSAGLHLQAGEAQWTLALRGLGYDDALQAVRPVPPAAAANRLEYAHGSFTEWYVHGPLGLEQGWTLNTPPATRGGAALTLAILVQGPVRLEGDGQTVALLTDDGATALRYRGLSAYDAMGRELQSWLEWGDKDGARSLLEIHVDDTGAQYPLTIDPYFQPQATLTNFSGVNPDLLGGSVAVSANGSTVVAGATGVRGDAGAAYVFVKPQSGWASTSSPAATLSNSVGASLDHLGFSAAMSSDGSTIVVGAPGANSGWGAVYVFVRSGSNWTSTSTPTAALSNAVAPGGQLGMSVGISADGSTVLSRGGSGGAVYVFVRSGSNWTTTSTPTAALSNAGAALGSSLAVSSDGSTIVAGDTGFNDAGRAYVFVRPVSGWTTTSSSTASLTNSGGASTDSLGSSVAVSSDGSIIVAGDTGINSQTGAAFVFAKPVSGWTTTSTPTASLTFDGGGLGGSLGDSVAISADGSIIVAGAAGASSYQGVAYVFVRPGSSWATSWTPTATLVQVGYLGGISSDGSTIVGRAPGFNGYRGAAYVFYRPSNDANLSNLVSSSGMLSPAFASGTTSYTAAVPHSIASIAVTPTASDSNATIQVRVNGGSYSPVVSGTASGTLSLHVGANPVEVLVTAPYGATTKTYTVVVNRPSNDANLGSLILSSGTLTPAFASGTTSYTAAVPQSIASIAVTPTASDSNATIQVRVNGGSYSPVASGMASTELSLLMGANPVEVLVTAEDGTTTKTYSVTVTRAAFPLYLPLTKK